ncbi:MAG: DUF3426 domain-containing protein [Phenylobacterium sp.]
MILTCPDCATSYFVDSGVIPAAGRTVKCSACGTRWTATAETGELELSGLDEALFEAETPEAETPEAETADLEEAPLSALPGDALPKVFRNKTETSRRTREAVAVGVVWAGMAAVVAATIGAAVIFRVDVVKLWPHTAAAYAGVGLPVNQIGLTIENLAVETTLKDGHAAYSITGAIRNVEGRQITAPPLKMSLLNASGRALVTKIARPADPRIAPGASRHFGLVIVDPPSTAAELEVSFATDLAPGAAAAKMAAHGGAEGKSLSLRRSQEPTITPPPLQPVEATAAAPDPHAAPPAHD